MGQYTAGWITVPGKGKRWRTADGEYLMRRPAGGMPGIVGSIRDAWRSADEQLGGWLPGGGTASPVSEISRRAKEASRSVNPAAIRDKVAIPVLDKGIESGLLPAAPAMFARYLSGTSEPLTALPASIKEDVSRLATQEVNPQEAAQDVYNGVIRERAWELWGKAWNAKKEEAVSNVKARQGPLQFFRTNNQNWLEQRAQADPIVQEEYERLLAQDTSPEKTRAEEARTAYLNAAHSKDPEAPFSVTHSTAYKGQDYKIGPSTLTLGSFTVKPSTREVVDRYKFDDLDKGKNPQGMYPDALAGGRPAALLIDFALNSGLITPQSGYDIRAKY